MTIRSTVTKGLTFVFAVGICLLVGSMGSYHTAPGVTAWYAGLLKPAFSLPSTMFSPIWTVSFILMGLSLYLILQSGIRKNEVAPGFLLFILQFGLIIAWSYSFFSMHAYFLAFMGIIAVWATLLSTIIQIFRFSVLGGMPLIPCFFWITYLVYLNYGIMVFKNATFVIF